MAALGRAMARGVLMEELDLSHNTLSAATLSSLCEGLVVSRSVRRLLLMNTRINDNSLRLLLPGLAISTLQEIDLARNGLTHNGVSLLSASLRKGNVVTSLDLSVNPLEDDGTVAVAVLVSEVASLKILSLSSVQANVIGARALVSTLTSSANQVETLRFAKNPNLGIFVPWDMLADDV